MIAPPDRTPLPREFFDRPVLEVGPDLLGRILVRTAHYVVGALLFSTAVAFALWAYRPARVVSPEDAA